MQVKVGQAFGFVPTFFKNLQKVVDICKKCSKIEKVVEAWLSLVERYIRDVEVASSNLVASTFLNSLKRCLQCFGEFFFFSKKNFHGTMEKEYLLGNNHEIGVSMWKKRTMP